MRVAMMQPYFYPYIGYWQLINFADVFVILDDVNYIKRGWINRNRILSDKVRYLNLPLFGVSQNKKINEIEINQESLQSRRNSKILHETYRKAPYYDSVRKLIDDSMYIESKNLAEYLRKQIELIASSLKIDTKIMASSEIKKPAGIKGQERIIWLCNELGAKEYINLCGGMALYDTAAFSSKGVQLGFLKANLTPYQQFGDDFVSALSVLDQMMFTGIDRTGDRLDDFEIVRK